MKYLVVYSGNVRTFCTTFESHYKYLLSILDDFHVLFYLKRIDPGPKGHTGYHFVHETETKENILNTIQKYLSPDKFTEYIIDGDEKDKDFFISKIKNINNYIGYFNEPTIDEKIGELNRPIESIVRAMNCHYNLYRCGEIIKEKNFHPEYIIWSRPDLQYDLKVNLKEFKKDKIILNGTYYNNDMFAVIPFQFLDDFFFKRFETYCENEDTKFGAAEDVYRFAIKGKYEESDYILPYRIRRPSNLLCYSY